MRADDFYINQLDTQSSMDADPWAEPVYIRCFDTDLVTALRKGPLPDRSDVEAAIALAELVHSELEAFGTGGGGSLSSNDDIGLAVIVLRSVTNRLGVSFELPYRNFATFYGYWKRNGAEGSWQARRDMLDEVFEPLHLELLRLEERTFDALADPISPRNQLGWPLVDGEVRELRRRFQAAVTPQDYRSIGGHCVGVVEALSRTVYDPKKHLDEGEDEPPVDKTKQRLGRYVERSLSGKANEELRRLVNSSIEFAQAVKHGSGGTRQDAGIAADATIMLANLLRRIDDDGSMSAPATALARPDSPNRR